MIIFTFPGVDGIVLEDSLYLSIWSGYSAALGTAPGRFQPDACEQGVRPGPFYHHRRLEPVGDGTGGAHRGREEFWAAESSLGAHHRALRLPRGGAR